MHDLELQTNIDVAFGFHAAIVQFLPLSLLFLSIFITERKRK
jgi:hypothetical protein